MRFLDANVVIYAYFIPRQGLSKQEILMKEKSKKIMGRIEKGEKVAISVVHISEIANVLRKCLTIANLSEMIMAFFTTDNIKVFDVNWQLYLKALSLAKELNISINDCLALTLMKDNNIDEIYTADNDFKKADGITPIFE